MNLKPTEPGSPEAEMQGKEQKMRDLLSQYEYDRAAELTGSYEHAEESYQEMIVAELVEILDSGPASSAVEIVEAFALPDDVLLREEVQQGVQNKIAALHSDGYENAASTFAEAFKFSD